LVDAHNVHSRLLDKHHVQKPNYIIERENYRWIGENNSVEEYFTGM
jgi:hypothetical protein